MSKVPGQHDGNINVNPEDMKRLVELRTSLSQLVKAIGYLQMANMNTPEPLLNWPEMFNSFATINRLTENIHNSFKEVTDEVNDDGTEVTKGDIINQLRVFPMSPFNAEGNYDFLDHTVRITPTYDEISWEDERLRAASQFCRVDPKLDVGHSAKAEEEAAKKKSGAEVEEEFGGLKRVKVDMHDEDDYPELWARAAFYSNEEVRLFGLAFPQFAPADHSGEYLDGDEAKVANIYRELGVTGETPEPVFDSAAEVQSAALPLSAMLKFMSTGTSDLASGARI
ncbi:hypothetical protein B0J11DRAFT_579142 [Dendryphion nanum]|uniref:Mediator complex subunit 8 n=1 Tax=Dendryphion nanum TaxID=256645 RepID=A0A9P9DU88_9PLEO|nr:hypothetical protein B0J11DRAFT_579142 [Dendryphion nanum]